MSSLSRPLAERVLATLAVLGALGQPGCSPRELPAPQLLGIEPASRVDSAPTTVTLRGRNLLPELTVSPAGSARIDAGFSAWLQGPIGQVPLDGVRFVDSRRLVAVVPGAPPAQPGQAALTQLPAGPYDLVLVTPQGETLHRAAAFEVRLPPRLLGVGPSRRGVTSGGALVELRGHHFVAGAQAWFGPRPLLDPVVVSSERLSGRLPPGEPGVVDLRVVTAYGEARLAQAFTYVPPGPLPVVEAVEPAHGPFGGGTAVAIRGAHFDAATRITFSGQPLLEPRWDAAHPERISGRTPAGEPGPATVQASGTAGDGPELPAGFVYDPRPTLLAVEPAAGPERGAIRVTVVGRGLTPELQLSFGDRPLLQPEWIDAEHLVGLAPPGRGPVAVNARSAAGDATLVDGFRYLPPPSVTALVPDRAPADLPEAPADELEVELRGSGFSAPGLAVTLGGVAVPAPLVLDDRRLRLRVPPGPPGTLGLVVRTDLGVAAVPVAFRHLAPLRLSGRAPDRGLPGTWLELRGDAFSPDLVAELGDPARGVAFVPLLTPQFAAGQLTGRVPPLPAGPLELRLTGGGDSLAVARAFFVLADGSVAAPLPPPAGGPRLLGIEPPDGPAGGGTPVVIHGAGFTPSTAFKLGGLPLTGLRIVAPDWAEGLTPGGFDLVGLELERDGEPVDRLERAFRYLGPLGLSDWWPRVGRSGTRLTVRGESLSLDLALTLGERPLPLALLPDDPWPPDPTQRTGIVPAGPAGELADLLLLAPTGRALRRGAFRYLPAAQSVLLQPDALSRALVVDAGGTVAWATDAGLWLVPGPVGVPEAVDGAVAGLPASALLGLAAPLPGLLLVGTVDGLAVCASAAPAVCRPVTGLDLAAPLAPLTLTQLGLADSGEALAFGPAGLLRVLLHAGGVGSWTPLADLPDLGLPAAEVRALARDGLGELWLATVAGLARYDVETRRFVLESRASTAGGLPADDVLALAPCPDGSVLVATAAGVVRREPGLDPTAPGWSPLTALDGLPVAALACAGDGAPWLISDGTLLHVAPGDELALPPAAGVGPPAGAAELLAVDPAGTVWVSGGGVLWRLVGP